MAVSKILIDGVGIDLTNDTCDYDNMLAGVKAHMNDGEPVTGAIPSKSAATYTPSLSAQTISAGQYLSGKQTISAVTKELLANLDADFVAGNIKKDVDLFGLIGTLEGGGGESFAETFTLTPAAAGNAVLKTGFSKKPILIAAIDRRVMDQSISGMYYKGLGCVCILRHFPNEDAGQASTNYYFNGSNMSSPSASQFRQATQTSTLSAAESASSNYHSLFVTGTSLESAKLYAKCGSGGNGSYPFEIGRTYYGVILYDRGNAV